jgi:hypothetical protein
MDRRLIGTIITMLIIASADNAIPSAQGTIAARGATGEALFIAPAERTLEERLQHVDAVMRVRINGPAVVRAIDITPVLERQNPGITFHRNVLPVTEYRTEVLEIAKGAIYGVPGATLRIGIMGGRAPWQGREVVVETRRPNLAPGATYLVLLDYAEEFGMLMFAATDIYRVDGATLGGNPLGELTEYGKRIVGRPSDEVLSTIRAITENAGVRR